MWEKLQVRQEILRTEIFKRDKVLRKQQAIEEQLKNAVQRKQSYLLELKGEQKDVDDLDRFSILNLVRTWTGKQDEKREKELLELAAVEAKFREVEKMITDLEVDIQSNDIQLQKIEWQSLDAEWDHLRIEKEQWIFQNNEDEARQLETLYEEKTAEETYIRELKEAVYACNEAKKALKRALRSLESAEGFSTWDTYLGGGLLATALKHSELDESENAIHDAQLALQRFQTELLDIQEIDTRSLKIDRDSFVTFADYFFDDIFSAWSIHSKIHSSIDRIENTLSGLNRIYEHLIETQEARIKKLAEIKSSIEQILE